MNIKENRNNQIQKKILSNLGKTFNLNRIYDFCMRQFGNGRVDIRQKYARILAHLHLMNKRKVQQEKQQNFIRQWRNIIESKTKFNYYPYLQELVKLLEIINLRMKQVPLLFEFLIDVTQNSWESLKMAIINRFKAFKQKIQTALQAIYFKKHKKEGKNQKDHIQFMVESVKSQQDSEYGQKMMGQTHESVDEESKFVNQSKPKQSNSYLVGPAKLFVKQKPQIIKLLTKQQLQQLRKTILSRNKLSNTKGQYSKSKQLQKSSPFKAKKENFNTYHTEIDEDSDQWDSKGESYKQISVEQQQIPQKVKKPIYRHHKSNFENYASIKKNISLQGSLKYRSIHKVQSSQINHQQPPSRYTIQSSTVNVHKSSDNPNPIFENRSKKLRMSKISIISKLQRTIKKIDVKKNNKQRGGVFLDKSKLKEIQEIYNNFNQNDRYQNNDSDQQKQSSNSSIKQTNNPIEKRNSEFIGFQKQINQLFEQTSSQKQFNKNRRRIGISTKILKSKKSVDLYSAPAKSTSSQKTSQIHNRTSIFRSSGFGDYNEQKKSIAKSRYRNQSYGILKTYNPDQQFFEGIDPIYKQKAQKRFALNKKSNQKLLTQPTAVTIDKSSIVSFSDMAKALGEIHHQDKQDRAGKYQQYYMQLFRRKYEGCNRSTQYFSQLNPHILKMDNSIQFPAPKRDNILRHQSLLFDFMAKTTKEVNGLEILQTGAQSPLQ